MALTATPDRRAAVFDANRQVGSIVYGAPRTPCPAGRVLCAMDSSLAPESGRLTLRDGIDATHATLSLEEK